MKKLLYLVLVCALLVSATTKQTVKIACLGDSITQGYGIENRNENSYPAQLAALLSRGYDVRNFGVSGATMTTEAYADYTRNQEYADLLEFQPDIIILCLGTNDSSKRYRHLAGGFESEYENMLSKLREAIKDVRIIVVTPPKVHIELMPSLKGENYIKDNIIPSIKNIAFKEKLEIVDWYHLFTEYDKSVIPDGVHPTAMGAGFIAERMYEYLTMESVEFDFDTKGITPTSFHGYDCYTFEFKGKTSHIVKPKHVAKNQPWIWRARFWNNKNANTGLDIALLERGFHLVYTDVSDMFGNKKAVKQFEDYYDYLVKGGLGDKCVLEGMSRGGLMVYNFAVDNPEKVAAVYGDAPFLNFSIFEQTDRKIGVKEKLFKAYGFKNEADALEYENTPIKNAEKIAKGGYTLIHICGTDDQSVPLEDNTLLFKSKIEKAGGSMIYIEKPGVGHHPHGLDNYEPVVKHLLKAVKSK